jgi:hypothetical protein
MIRRLLLLAGALVLLMATPAHAQYSPGVITNPQTVVAGNGVEVAACCFQPGTTVTFMVGGATLGTAIANPSGVAGGVFVVPASAGSGALTITASGVDAAGNPVTQTGAITVSGGTTATTAGVGGLPVTGSDSALPLSLLAAGLVVVGATTLFVVRTRRESVSH